MRAIQFIILYAVLVVSSSGHSFAQEISQSAFEANLFGISEISHFGIDKTRFDEMSANQRVGVLGAKKVLLTILKSLQDRKGKINVHLTNAMNNKFPTKKAFAQGLVDEETSLLGLLVTDFAVLEDGKKVELGFSVLTSSEGTIVTGNKKATLTAVGPSWKLDDIQ